MIYFAWDLVGSRSYITLHFSAKNVEKKYEQISGKKSFSYCKMMVMMTAIIIIIIIIIIFTIFDFQWI